MTGIDNLIAYTIIHYHHLYNYIFNIASSPKPVLYFALARDLSMIVTICVQHIMFYYGAKELWILASEL